MEASMHTMNQLFEQLGLPSDDAAIDAFVARHRPLDSSMKLSEAPFWSSAQACFLREEILDDADWAEVVDRLDALMRD